MRWEKRVCGSHIRLLGCLEGTNRQLFVVQNSQRYFSVATLTLSLLLACPFRCVPLLFMTQPENVCKIDETEMRQKYFGSNSSWWRLPGKIGTTWTDTCKGTNVCRCIQSQHIFWSITYHIFFEMMMISLDFWWRNWRKKCSPSWISRCQKRHTTSGRVKKKENSDCQSRSNRWHNLTTTKKKLRPPPERSCHLLSAGLPDCRVVTNGVSSEAHRVTAVYAWLSQVLRRSASPGYANDDGTMRLFSQR